MRVEGKSFRTVWLEGSVVRMIDQPLLPHRFAIADMATAEDTARAIETMVVRGAGAIGATGAFGVAQAAVQAPDRDFAATLRRAADMLGATRPTAQNLFYGIRTVLQAIEPEIEHPQRAREAAVAAAQGVADDDARSCETIGERGESLIDKGARVSTHCNAGWLAFVDWGSALSPVYKAHRNGKEPFVYVDETRPR